jgi:hypothetical protein
MVFLSQITSEAVGRRNNPAPNNSRIDYLATDTEKERVVAGN